MSRRVRLVVTPNTPYDELPEWLSIAQTAIRNGSSEHLIREGIRNGEIPYRRIGPKFIQIPKQFLSPDNAVRGNGGTPCGCCGSTSRRQGLREGSGPVSTQSAGERKVQ